MGPNVKKLIARKISMDAVPRGGSAGDVVWFLLDKERVSATAKAATKWVQEALAVVRTAAEPNPSKLDYSDWCPSCQKSQRIHEQYRKTVTLRQNAMRRLVRLAKKRIFVRVLILPGVILVNGKEHRYPEDFPIQLPANTVLLPGPAKKG